MDIDIGDSLSLFVHAHMKEKWLADLKIEFVKSFTVQSYRVG